jgi:WD40 repeat protein
MSGQGSAPVAPYKGLTPYGEDDAMLFFGREEEQHIIAENLRAFELTVLYGATGVGKSSVLRAGVVGRLRAEAATNVAELGVPELVVAIVSNWRDDPLVEVRSRIEEAIAQTFPEALADPAPTKLDEAIKHWTERIEGPVLLIFDQFEEYFLYQRGDSGEREFDVEFPRLVTNTDVHVNVLISIREDALAWLDRFKAWLPGLFDNSIRIRHLDRDKARLAIEGPLRRHNEAGPPEAQVRIEEALVDTVLDELRFGRVALGGRGQALISHESVTDTLQGSIETPYLQLVMRRLWDAEVANGSSTLRLTTLTEQLGGAGHIVRTHLDASMEGFRPDQKQTAAKAFQFLVTPSGTKFAHVLADLAHLTEVPEEELAPIMARLADLRILRQVPASSGQGDVLCYEIFHDVLAPAILDWRTRQVAQAEREELERQLARQREEAFRWRQQTEAAERAKEEAVRQRLLALSNELAANATLQRGVDPELSVLLAVEAVRASASALAVDTLRQSLLECRIRAVLKGHGGDLNKAAFSADGRLVATACQDGVARVWTVPDGRELHHLRGHGDWVWDLAFSPDGGRLVTAANDGTARLWDMATGSVLAVLDHGVPVRSAVFDGAGALVLTGGDDGAARLWHGATGAPVAVLAGHAAAIWRAVFAPDGRRVVTAAADHEAMVWDARGGRREAVLRGHDGPLWSVAVSPDGRLAVTASADDTAAVWDLDAGARVATLRGHGDDVITAEFDRDGGRVVTASLDRTARVWEARGGRGIIDLRAHLHAVYSASFSPDGRSVLTASLDGTALVFEVDTGRPVSRLRGHTRPVNFAAFSPDGTLVVTTSQDATARLWDSGTGEVATELTGHIRQVYNVSFSPDGALLASASGDHTVRLWDVASRRTVRRLAGHEREVGASVFSRDGTLLATASWDGSAAIWRADSGEELVRLRGHTREVYAIAFSPDGTLAVTGSVDGTARIWEVATGRQVLVLEGHEDEVNNVAWSPDGRLIATGSSDMTARLWDPATGRTRAELPGHTDALSTVSFSPDSGSLLTASDDRTARRWDIATARITAEFRGHTGRVHGAAFSPDGSLVVTASEDRTSTIWDSESGRPLVELRGHASAVTAAAFSPDGDWIASGAADGTIRIVPRNVRVSVEDLLDRARQRVTRELTAEERRVYVDASSAPEILSG